MRIGTAKALDLFSSVRLDSKFFLDEAQVTYQRLTSGRWKLVTVKDTFGAENVWAPNRFERVPAGSVEFGKPILVPYDCFRYLPHSDSFLSKKQVKVYDKLELKRGYLLIVCSGRNLGPVTMADSFLEQFVLSHDMIRVSPGLTDDLFYLTALLHTKTGQTLVRLDRNGSVVDHLSPAQVGAMRYPLVDDKLKKKSVDAFREAFELREKARLAIDKLAGEYLDYVGLSPEKMELRRADLARRFDVRRSEVSDRFDSEPFAPAYRTYNRHIAESGCATLLVELADILHLGRKKTLHVTDEKFGVKILSGRQVAQYRTIGLKLVSNKAWSDLNDYLITEGTVVLTCDGRAEENLADCALIRGDRKGWAATEHIIRLKPKPGIHAGLLYLACSSRPVQQILKSQATGSVVDAIRPAHLAPLMVPYPNDAPGKKLGDRAVAAWDQFSRASKLEQDAVAELEEALA